MSTNTENAEKSNETLADCPFCGADIAGGNKPKHIRECPEVPGRDVDRSEDYTVVRLQPVDGVGELTPGRFARAGHRGPFRIREVVEKVPSELQRTDAVTLARLTYLRTGTDWMVIQEQSSRYASLYVRTKDVRAKGGYRFKKVDTDIRLAHVTLEPEPSGSV